MSLQAMPNKTDIVLIQPPGWAVQNPPLGLALLKSYLSGRGLICKVFDLNIILYNLRKEQFSGAWDPLNGYYTWERSSFVKKLLDFYAQETLYFTHSILSLEPRVIGFSVHSSSYLAARLLAEKFRELSPEVKIVFGGPQVAYYTSNWSNLFSCGIADAVFFGEAEEALAEYLQAEKAGYPAPIKGVAIRDAGNRIINGELRDSAVSLDSLPFADFSDFKLPLYAGTNVLPTYFSRGCLNSCIYCTENKFFFRFRNRSGKRLFEEIAHQVTLYPRTRYFRMHDSVSNGSIGELEKFCDLLINNKIKIGFNLENAIIRKEMDSKLYQKLKKSGCNIIGYGMENPSKPLLHSVGKKACLEADFDRVINEGARSKILIGVNMMFGLPGESQADFQKQLDFLKRHRANRNYILINPALNFCYFPQGCAVQREPEKFKVDLSGGQLYWSSLDGTNTFPERMKKFEKFCALANRLRYKNIFGNCRIINKHELLGNYYYQRQDYQPSLYHFKKSYLQENKTSESAESILKIYDKLSLVKDAFYAELAKFISRTGAESADSVLNRIRTREDLSAYIMSRPLSQSMMRIKGLFALSLRPEIRFTVSDFKNWIKYAVSILTGQAKRKRIFVLRELLENINNK